MFIYFQKKDIYAFKLKKKNENLNKISLTTEAKNN